MLFIHINILMISIRKAYSQNRNGCIPMIALSLTSDPVSWCQSIRLSVSPKNGVLADRGSNCRRTPRAPPLRGCRSATKVAPSVDQGALLTLGLAVISASESPCHVTLKNALCLVVSSFVLLRKQLYRFGKRPLRAEIDEGDGPTHAS
jgi:hypothetical protein